MSEVKRWSGNVTTQASLSDNELEQLYNFCNSHNEVYIYGNGKIGSALAHYCKQAGISIKDSITSDVWNEVKTDVINNNSGVIIGVGDQILLDIQSNLAEVRKENIFLLSSQKRNNMAKVFSKEYIKDNFWINIYVTNKCNLNCKSCSAFAPICKPDFYSFAQFKKDIQQIKELELSNISVFKFTGAEALLHPDIVEMFKAAREFFPSIDFECYTNGLNFKIFDDISLEKIRDLNVTFIITEYPVKGLDLSDTYKRLDLLSVKYSVIYSEGQKYFSKRPIDLEKKTPKYMFYYCPRYKTCDSLFLFNGRLYKCIYALSSGYFNEAFNTSLILSEKDYLDIYNVTSDDVYEYFRTRIPFCGYCAPIEEKVPWGLSERKISEWV